VNLINSINLIPQPRTFWVRLPTQKLSESCGGGGGGQNAQKWDRHIEEIVV
jgi:hypothetical protein